MVFFLGGGQFCDVAKVEDLAEYWLPTYIYHVEKNLAVFPKF